jgi:hypothetical protein
MLISNTALLFVNSCLADCSGWGLCLRLPLLHLDVMCDVSVAPGGVFIADVNPTASNHVGCALGTLGLGLAKIVLLCLNRRWTSHLFYVTDLFIVSVIISIIITDIAVVIIIFTTLSSSIPSSSGTSIFSLLYVIGFLLSKN